MFLNAIYFLSKSIPWHPYPNKPIMLNDTTAPDPPTPLSLDKDTISAVFSKVSLLN